MTFFIPDTRWTHGVIAAIGFYGAAVAIFDLGPPQPLYFIFAVRWWKTAAFKGGHRVEWHDYRDNPRTYARHA